MNLVIQFLFHLLALFFNVSLSYAQEFNDQSRDHFES